MRQAVATDAAPRGWGMTCIVTVLGTLACTALAAWFNGFAGEPVNVLIVTLIAAPLLFAFANSLRLMAVARRRQVIAASSDPLTGLLYRQAFMAAVGDYLGALNEFDRPATGAFLAIDIDNLKAINDAFGHEAGDAAIAELARILRRSVRHSDLIGRLGGDEFGVLLLGPDQFQSQLVADRLCEVVTETQLTVAGKSLPLGISVGIGLYRETTTLPELIAAADRALYAAKQNGGNRAAISPVESQTLRVAA